MDIPIFGSRSINKKRRTLSIFSQQTTMASTTKSTRRRSSATKPPVPLPGSALWMLTETHTPRTAGATATTRTASVSKSKTVKKTTPSVAPASKATRQSATAAKKKHSNARNDDGLATEKPVRKRVSTTTASGTSLVHDAVRRAFHASVASEARSGRLPDYAAECERLREELERVMADHQRQADEIVALRALAKSLKEEVETMQESMVTQQQDRALTSDESWQHTGTEMRRAAGHEFFQLDAQIDALKEENALLRDQLQTTQSEKHELQVVIDSEMPRFELLSVHAQAELASSVSQLRDEQAENDRLRSEVAYYKARSRSPVRAGRQQNGSMEIQERREIDKESVRHETANRGSQLNAQVQAWDSTLRESLMSSVASMSMSAASVFSSQLENDVETLKSELRRLHRSIDASVENARRYGSSNNQSRRPRPVEEHKASE